MGWNWTPSSLLITHPSREPRAIAYQLVRPEGKPKAALLFQHGYSEYAYWHREAIEHFTARGILVAAYDLWGHGDSGGIRGHIRAFHDYVNDALALLDTLSEDTDWQTLGPPTVLGTSLGGLIGAHLAACAPHRLRGLCLASPYFGLAFPAPAHRLALGRILYGLWPTCALRTGISAQNIHSDGEIAQRFATDPRVFKTTTAGWFFETRWAQSEAMRHAGEIRVPVLCLQAGDDRIAQREASERFVKAIGHEEKAFRLLPGAFHAIFSERERTAYMDEFADATLRWAASTASSSA